MNCCPACGVLVGDVERHYDWHRSQSEEFDYAPPCMDMVALKSWRNSVRAGSTGGEQ